MIGTFLINGSRKLGDFFWEIIDKGEVPIGGLMDSRGPTAEEQDGRMRILLADDAALLREGLAGLLAAAGHEVVAQVADADALRTEVARLATAGELPDVVVTDVRMPPTRTDDGLRAGREIGRASCGKECRSRWSPYH